MEQWWVVLEILLLRIASSHLGGGFCDNSVLNTSAQEPEAEEQAFTFKTILAHVMWTKIMELLPPSAMTLLKLK